MRGLLGWRRRTLKIMNSFIRNVSRSKTSASRWNKPLMDSPGTSAKESRISLIRCKSSSTSSKTSLPSTTISSRKRGSNIIFHLTESTANISKYFATQPTEEKITVNSRAPNEPSLIRSMTMRMKYPTIASILNRWPHLPNTRILSKLLRKICISLF